MCAPLSPDTKIVFVTGYPDYALDAYQIHADGYILKPATPDRILEELENGIVKVFDVVEL